MSSEVGNTDVGTDGLLVLSLWTEPGLRMRVRITRTTHHRPGPSTSYAATKAEVLKLVDAWLDDAMAEVESREGL